MRSIMIACVQAPRFELVVAAGSRVALLSGEPLALAPEPGREPLVGQPSAAAEAVGVREGMLIGEALARCPGLRLVAPDPDGVADAHDRLLTALESIGAAVEGGRPGVAWFDVRALRHLHRGGPEAVVAAARAAIRRPVRFGLGPTRFVALAATSRAHARRPEVVRGDPAAYLAELPVSLLGAVAGSAEGDTALAALPGPLERLGVRTLGELAGLPRAAVADRFGPAGLRARDLARGCDAPLRPRDPVERLEVSLELPESADGSQLDRALGLLIDRLLARPELRSRALRSVVVSARLVEGGTWRERMAFREPLADRDRMRLVLVPRLATLPAPAELLRLRVEGFGPPAGAQGALVEEPADARNARLREAIRQVRAAAGPDAALRILEVDPDSRVPERRLVLAPWET